MGERESGYAAWRAEQERNDPGARALEAIGIDPKTKRAISPDPPRYPPGPIAICVYDVNPIHREFIERVRRVVGADIVVVVNEDDPKFLPDDCFGVIGMEMWVIGLESVRRGIELCMLATMEGYEIEGMDVNWSLPGHRVVGYEDDWRAVVDEEARRLVRAHNEATQHHVTSLLSPSDVGEPTVFSRQIMGQSGQVYDFERIVGLGGTAIVAAVRDEEGTRFAAKALSAHRFPIENREERFELEGRLLIEVKHPNVLAAIDLATMDEDTPVLVFEYLAGGSVHARLASGRPDLAVAERWLREALRGLDALQARDIVHRDVSAKNLLLDGADRLVIADFGTARHLDDATLTAATDRIGSLIYMAPEQLDDPHGAGFPADVYSMGQVGFQLLTGLVPLGNTGSARSHDDDVPAHLSDAVEVMRSYRPEDRPVSAAAALELLDAR